MPNRHDPSFDLVDDTSWSGFDIQPGEMDPGIRLVASLIDIGDAEQLFRRTGMRLGSNRKIANPHLPLFVDLNPEGRSATLKRLASAKVRSEGFSISFAPAFLEEAARNPRLSVLPAQLRWTQGPIVLSTRSGQRFRGAIARLLRDRGIGRIGLPNPLQPALEGSLADMEMPPNRMFQGRKLTGQGVIVGIIDDGCALAHRHFMRPGTLQSRIKFFWDQAGATPPAGDPHWTNPGNFGGRELTDAKLDPLLAACAAGGLIDEDEVYRRLGYELDQYALDISAHGTHVMDIAAGNGSTMMGSEGVANEADIVFVQLPRDRIEQGGAALETHILEGVKYIFDRAKGQQAVVNISFGGYCGPHDGSSLLAAGMDQLLQADRGRAVVVAAGNGFEADCHALQVVEKGSVSQPLVWLVRPEDPTSSQLEVWYDGAASLELLLTSPDGTDLLPPVGLNQWKAIVRTSDNAVIGWIQHEPVGGSNLIRINLAGTVGEDGSGAAPAAPAPSGAWTLLLANVGQRRATCHAWIERDDMRRRRGRRGQQSRFEEANVDPRWTVADLGTGLLVISVGGHNTATGEMCRYSACGPTRDGRQKPDVTAPAEETPTGGGVLSASARQGRPTRMAGTSAAAPHVAGLVALLMQFTEGKRLTAAQIVKRIRAGAAAGGAKNPPPRRQPLHNTHQEVDPRRPPAKRQATYFTMVTGAGKVNAIETP